MSQNIQRDKVFWSEIDAAKDWDRLTSPWRPSLRDIKNYEAGIKFSTLCIKRILILGATPELRDLTTKFVKKVWLVDYSLDMLYEMSKLLKLADPKKEKWIVDDWCQCKRLRKKSFDVILGDLVLRLISPNRQNIFLEKVTNLLRQQGLFITRIHFVNNSLKKLSPEEIINLTLSLSDPSVPGRGRYIGNLLSSRLLDKNFSFGEQQKIRKKSQINISNYLEENPGISSNKKRILEGALGRLGGEKEAPFFLQERKVIEENLNKFFNIKRKLVAKDYDDSRYFLVYILKPKL